MKQRSIKSTKKEINLGITAQLSEKIPTLEFNNLKHANVGISH